MDGPSWLDPLPRRRDEMSGHAEHEGVGIELVSVELICAADVKMEPTAWLWKHWLVAGEVQILAGAPSTGKTTAALALAATISCGGRWPDGTPAEVGNVLIWSGEDCIFKTLTPRLAAMGADLKRVHMIGRIRDETGTRAFDPSTDMLLLEAAMARGPAKPRLLIVDPVVSAVAGDSHKNAEVRRSLQPLVDLARATGCAVLGITHFSKGTAGREVAERVTGSLAFGAIARLVLATAKLPDDKGGDRLLLRAKSNLGPIGGGFRYEVQAASVHGIETTRLLWGAAVEGDARELLAQAEAIEEGQEKSERDEAGDWLTDLLSVGRMKSKDVRRKADDCGYAWRTVQRAADTLKVEKRREGFGQEAVYWWSLPPCVPADPHACQPETVAHMNGSGTHEREKVVL